LEYYKFIEYPNEKISDIKVGDIIQLGQKPEKRYELKWLEKSETPFNRRILDCREYAINSLSFTDNSETINTFKQLRYVHNINEIRRLPQNAIKGRISINGKRDLNFQLEHKLHKLFLFKSLRMEEKWDIYRDDKYFYFSRSWTGEMVYVCRYHIDGLSLTLSKIFINREKIDRNDEEYDFKVIDFLIVSHIMNIIKPHPIPYSIKNDPVTIAETSFLLFGNRGFFCYL